MTEPGLADRPAPQPAGRSVSSAAASEPAPPVLEDVDTPLLDPACFRAVVGEEAFGRFATLAGRARRLLDGRTVWNVNTTARGGGVAEMLRPLLGYARGGGLDARWVVVCGDEPFFRVTKRIHHRLHGSPGDGGPLDGEARREYDGVLARAARRLVERVRPGDVVVLHDPQTLGLARAVRERGALVIWRCHVGTDRPDGLAREAWDFLRPDLEHARTCVFSRRVFAFDGLEPERVAVVAPSIDAFSAKNQALSPRAVTAVLERAGILAGGIPHTSNGAHPAAAPADGDLLGFVRADGSRGRLDRRAILVGDPLPAGAPAVVQVSRWDPLKDPLGVLRAFRERVAPAHPDARLVLAGPDVSAVNDDPEGAQVLQAVTEAWQALPAPVRSRVTLVSLPMDDADENALMVNALQRHAAVIVQKSLAEGFGLTVVEAMWKGRPVVASAVGGIQDQLEDGVSGILVADPADTGACGDAVARLLADRAAAEEMGARAHARARDEYLAPRHLAQYAELVARLL